ncbi:Hypothetical_protein [Hexamita inflata]|uniref:Hypothetical_protein n=1 Tax=Hexamita inflata TaxID=28002 RepID=A0AA86VA12_9EUKA|nr:Hypothetical protein HINF_LOCUS42667 [Hexamita inflata]CAI9960643.1 Hypothetical protein HINF_LOCUS48288 [Hexamita inflata]
MANNQNLTSDIPITFDLPALQAQKAVDENVMDLLPTMIQAPVQTPWDETIDIQNIPNQIQMRSYHNYSNDNDLCESESDIAIEKAVRCTNCCVCFTCTLMYIWEFIKCILMCISLCVS